MSGGDNPSIERFLQGNMDETERLSFEQEMAVDKELADEVAFRRDVSKTISRKKLLASVAEQLEKEDFFSQQQESPKIPERKPLKLRRYLAYAAAITLLLCLGLYWYAQVNFSDQRLAAISFEEIRMLNLTGTTKGLTQAQNTLLLETTTDLQVQDYEAANDKLDQLLQESPQNAAALLYKAYTQQQQADASTEGTIEALLSQESTTLIKQKAEWLQVKHWLSQNQDGEDFQNLLQAIIDNPNHQFNKQAIALQSKLQSNWRLLLF